MKKLLLTPLIVTLFGLTIGLLPNLTINTASTASIANENPINSINQLLLQDGPIAGITFQLEGSPPFTISVSDKENLIRGIVPITANRGDITKASAIEVAALPLESGGVKVSLISLYGRIDENTSACDLLLALKRERVSIFEINANARQEDLFSQPEISQQGIPPLSIQVVRKKPTQVGKADLQSLIRKASFSSQTPDGQPTPPDPNCCNCGSLRCCPNPGRCLGCGTCGECCRSSRPVLGE